MSAATPHLGLPNRILLCGGTGQIGGELLQSLSELGQVISPPRTCSKAGIFELDLSDSKSIRRTMQEVRPALVINAAAYTAVDRAERDQEVAMIINGIAPGILAEEAKRIDAALVHYSTDYVFDGSRDSAWREEDPASPLNFYGQSKLAGEQAIRASGIAHLILRTSWVYSANRNNFVRSMLRLGRNQTMLKVVNDQFGSPTSAREVADVTTRVLRQANGEFHNFLKELGGTVHLSCQGKTSWYGFSLRIFEIARRRGCTLAIKSVEAIASNEYQSVARRPKNSQLDCSRLKARFGIQTLKWQEALEQSMDTILSAHLGESK